MQNGLADTEIKNEEEAVQDESHVLSLQMDYYSLAFYAFYLNEQEQFDHKVDKMENRDDRLATIKEFKTTDNSVIGLRETLISIPEVSDTSTFNKGTESFEMVEEELFANLDAQIKINLYQRRMRNEGIL